MTIKELVEQVADSDKALLAGIPRKKAITLLRAVFTRVGSAIGEAEDGVVQVPGLGQFHVRRIEREVGGKPVTRKIVTFRRAGAKRRGQEPSGKD